MGRGRDTGRGGRAARAAQSARVQAVVDRVVAQGLVPGVVAAIAGKEDAAVHVGGRMAFGGAPLQRDAIFRIQSLTKPIVAVAALSLVEEGRIGLDDAVDPWLPELANRRVLARIDGPLDETVPANRSITLRDLLTFRFGLGQLFADPETHPILQAMEDAGISADPGNGDDPDPDTWMRRLGELPLMDQPGERWIYNTGSDVLGVLIARIAGESLEDALRGRVLGPLGMSDTGFSVSAERLNRLVTSYEPVAPATGGDGGAGQHPEEGDRETHRVLDDPAASAWRTEPRFASGAGGLVSTVDDYLRFARMLLNGGSLEGIRVLGRAWVQEMTTDHLTAEQRTAAAPFLEPSTGWGFGVAVVESRTEIWDTPGRYGWYGGQESAWFNDPETGLITILLANTWVESSGWPPVIADFWTAVYGG